MAQGHNAFSSIPSSMVMVTMLLHDAGPVRHGDISNGNELVTNTAIERVSESKVLGAAPRTGLNGSAKWNLYPPKRRSIPSRTLLRRLPTAAMAIGS